MTRAEGPSVAVIGAGAAGLSAGRALARRGAIVRIFEARGRVGGRVQTDRSFGAPIELGASYIQGAKGNPISALARQAGAVVQSTDYQSFAIYRTNGERVPPAEFAAAEDAFQKLRGDIQAEGKVGETIAETVQRIAPGALDQPLLAMQAAGEFEFDVGGPISQIGSAQLDRDDRYEGDDLYLLDGYDRLMALLAEGLDVQLSTPVHTISLEKSRVRVTTPMGASDWDYCVLTAPIGVLKAGSIAIEPGLPEAVARAIVNIGAGEAMKIALRFDRAFWDFDAEYIGYAGGLRGRFPVSQNFNVLYPSTNILMTFALGDYAARLADEDDDAIAADATAMLRDIYGAKASPPSATIVSRWPRDPFSRASYSFAGRMTRKADFDAFKAIVGGRLLFAGEHTSARYRGTVHGAYWSGWRAAQQIARLAAGRVAGTRAARS